jgi:hypothetical protein
MERRTMDRTFIEQRLNDHFGARRPTRWVTRERPKIDRIACPWLIRRFVDPGAEILYVPTAEVFEVARREQALAFDIPGAPFTHVGELCSFDAFLEAFSLEDEGLAALAPIIRGADTDRHDLAPQASGLHALSLGLTLLFDDDQALLAEGLVVYDALYAWATRARGERHDWRPTEL